MEPPAIHRMSSHPQTVMPQESDLDEDIYVNPVNDSASTSSVASDFSRSRPICVATESHKKPRMEPFQHVALQLHKQESCKVVVVVCLTKIMDEMGVWRQVDVQSFSGINQRKLKVHRELTMAMWNHFLTTSGIRRDLLDRGVQVEICVAAGYPRTDVLIEAVKAIQPRMVVLDRSFEGTKSERALQKRLECTVLLVINSKEKKILKLNTGDQSPSFDQSRRLHGDVNVVKGSESSSNLTYSGSVPDVGRSQSGGSESQELKNVSHPSLTVTQNHSYNSAAASVEADSGRSYALCICFCGSPKGERKSVPPVVPTHGAVVLYEDPGPNARDVRSGHISSARTLSSSFSGERFQKHPSR